MKPLPTLPIAPTNGTRGLVGSLLCLVMSYVMTWQHEALAAVALLVAGCSFYRLAQRRSGGQS